MNNAELIKALRCEMYGDDECDKSSCPIWSELGCRNGIANRAAAGALEAAEQRIDELENDKTNLEAEIINLEIELDKAHCELVRCEDENVTDCHTLEER